jgi:hypothetical protein
VVPIIRLPGISFPGFASGHAAEWFHISTEKLCYQSQFLPHKAAERNGQHTFLCTCTSFR